MLTSIPYDLLHLIFETVAASNNCFDEHYQAPFLHTLLSLSSTSRAFRNLYKTNEVSLLRTALEAALPDPKTYDMALELAKDELSLPSDPNPPPLLQILRNALRNHAPLTKLMHYFQCCEDDSELSFQDYYDPGPALKATYMLALNGVSDSTVTVAQVCTAVGPEKDFLRASRALDISVRKCYQHICYSTNIAVYEFNERDECFTDWLYGGGKGAWRMIGFWARLWRNRGEGKLEDFLREDREDVEKEMVREVDRWGIELGFALCS